MSVASRVATLDSYVSTHDPFGRLQGEVFVDAQAAILWVQLGILEEVLGLVPMVNNQPRFRMQDAALRETVGVLSGRFGAGTRAEVRAHFSDYPNLYLDEPIPASSSLGAEVTDVQERVFLEAGEQPSDWPPSRHLGEAEALAFMRLFARGAIFVTADKDAAAVAVSAGIGRPIKPLAFAAGLMHSVDDLKNLWGYICYARECVTAGAWHEPCVQGLQCNDFHDGAIPRSPISPTIMTAKEVLKWMYGDVEQLVAAIP